MPKTGKRKMTHIVIWFKKGYGKLPEDIRKKIEWLWKRITVNPLSVFVVLFIICFFFISIFSLLKLYNRDQNWFQGVLIEAHGMLFDIFVLGIIVTWLNQKGETERRVQRYLEEIDDYLESRVSEASFRIVGNIKRLNREGVSRIKLTNACLREAILKHVNLKGANLSHVNLRNANLFRAILTEANLNFAHCRGAYLLATDFRDANLYRANLSRTILRGANLSGAKLIEANLNGADCRKAIFKNTDLLNSDLQGADLTGAKHLTVKQLLKVKTLSGCFMDADLKIALYQKSPELFDLTAQAGDNI